MFLEPPWKNKIILFEQNVIKYQPERRNYIYGSFSHIPNETYTSTFLMFSNKNLITRIKLQMSKQIITYTNNSSSLRL